MGKDKGPKRKLFVTFVSPGTLFPETTSKEISDRDTRLAVKMSREIKERWGARPHSFYFEERIVRGPVDDGEGGTMDVESKTVNTSPGVYFIGGRLETLDEVERRADPSERVLVRNMRFNDTPIVVVNENSYRACLPFGRDDILLDGEGEVVERGDSPKWQDYRKRAIARVKEELECESP